MSVMVMVGAPASGKSTVGKALAQRLGVPFIDVDAAIEENTGKRIGDIFVDDGEAAFRRMEADATLALIKQPAVVSLGGGAVLNPDIRAALADHTVCWLQVSITHAFSVSGRAAALKNSVSRSLESVSAMVRGSSARSIWAATV